MSESKKYVDQYGNVFVLNDELSRGGQGVVYKTDDPNLLVKVALLEEGSDESNFMEKRFHHLRLLPVPEKLALTLPKSILRGIPGYTMQMLKEMQPVSRMDRDYGESGGARLRYEILYLTACVLSRLHHNGLVFCDVSGENVFYGTINGRTAVCLIDADNLYLESVSAGQIIYTTPFAAPEVFEEKDFCRPRSDCWSFSILAYKMLRGCHPFEGEAVNGIVDEDGCLASQLPFMDDENDSRNRNLEDGIPRELCLTPALNRLFQETLGAGRLQPYRRVGMAIWARELAKAYDLSIVCPACKMSYMGQDYQKCPACGASRPAMLILKTGGWTKVYQKPDSENENAERYVVPNRLLKGFSVNDGNDVALELEVDFEKKRVMAIRGQMMPEKLDWTFTEENHEV